MYIKHLKSKSSEYKAWLSLKARCFNQKDKDFDKYGGRGITVCGRWLDSFENFFEDMGLKISPKYSLDRIDVNGNYCKENCRWATYKEQMNNKTTTTIVTYNDETAPLSYFAEKYGFGLEQLRQRLVKIGIKEAIERPLIKRRTSVTYKNETNNLKYFCRKLSLSYDAVRTRIRKGWSIEKAIDTPITKYKQRNKSSKTNP